MSVQDPAVEPAPHRWPASLPDVVGANAIYHVYEQIGTGGMGQVYRCENSTTGESFALKCLTPGHNVSDEHEKRFRREIDTLKLLVHPHIVRLHDTGTHENRPYYVMTMLSGGSLLDLIDRQHILAVDSAVRI